MERQVSEQLVMRWLPIVDASGHTRMEATWVSLAVAAPVGASSSDSVSHAA